MQVRWLTQGGALNHSENTGALRFFSASQPLPLPWVMVGQLSLFRILEFSKPLTKGVSCIQFHNLCLAVGWEEMGSFWNRAFWAVGSHHENNNLQKCLFQTAVDEK